MKYDYEDCFEELYFIELDTKVDIDYTVLTKVEKDKRKIRNNNKKFTKTKLENKE